MIGRLRQLRLVPIVLFATISLFSLKTIGLLIDGHYALDESRPLDEDVTGAIPGAPKPDSLKPDPPSVASRSTSPQPSPTRAPTREPTRSWAQQMFNYPDVTGAVEKKEDAPPKPAENTGDKPAEKGRPKAAAPIEPPASDGGWKPVPLDSGRAQSPAEMAILARLQERRAELDARAKEIEMRESLLKAAEKRLEGRLAELKDLEARINNAVQSREEGEAARFKNVVTMYENMKPKDAAKIFDRLDLRVLVEVAREINPRRMSDIMAQMQPDSAQQLTVELAARSAAREKAGELPKIEGKP
jgi:flagellar motility protein MotE (MotC chaperone)